MQPLSLTGYPLTAEMFARRFLADVGAAGAITGAADHPALAWRRAGLMTITGRPTGPGLMCPIPLAAAADGALMALRSVAPPPAILPMNGAVLLGERARLLGLTRRGRTSANGACHLLDARHGRIALNLARPDDWSLLEAWLETAADDLSSIAAVVKRRSVAELVERGVMLGMAVAADAARGEAAWCQISEAAPRPRRGETPLVVDLSGLWAGPLAGALLQAMGARVIKIESPSRPDGARAGDSGFFDLLNGGKACVALDLTSPDCREALSRLIARADIVIDAMRPRALRQLGIDADAVARAGATWVSITGHGHEGADANRIGFGDDAAVAGGLAQAMLAGWGEALFAGDAIADPLTGLLAALAAWVSWRKGGGSRIALSLRDTIGFVVSAGVARGDMLTAWQSMAEADDEPLYPMRRATAVAAELGADNAAVFTPC